MKLILVICFAILCGLTLIEDVKGQRYARCTCAGCRPKTFHCNYNTFGGCDCARCRCIYSPRPPSRTCCSTCGWWFRKKYRCWKCPIARGCNYKKCGCY